MICVDSGVRACDVMFGERDGRKASVSKMAGVRALFR